MADGDAQRDLAIGLRETIGGVAEDSSGAMSAFHTATADAAADTSRTMLEQDSNLAEGMGAIRPGTDTLPAPRTETTPAGGASDDAAAENAADQAAAAQAKINDLRSQGHGPQRHLDATDQQLKDRLGTPVVQGNPPRVQLSPDGYVVSTRKIDPARPGGGALPDTDPLKYKDMYSTDAAGDPRNHRCGNYSTAFGDPESMAKAEQSARSSIPSTASGSYRAELDAQSTIGAEGVANLRGKYIDPSNPMTGTQINYKDVDFSGSKILAVYDQDPTSGDWNLTTMYPEPDAGANP